MMIPLHHVESKTKSNKAEETKVTLDNHAGRTETKVNPTLLFYNRQAERAVRMFDGILKNRIKHEKQCSET